MTEDKTSIKETRLIQFLTNASIMASTIFIPVLAQNEFNSTKFEIGLIVAAYGIALFFSSYIFGRLSDIHGRRFFIRIGLIASAVLFFLQVFAVNVSSLIIFRVLAGFSAGIFPAALIAYVYESKNMLGKFSSYGSLGWAFGSLITAAFAVNLFGWFELNFYNLIFISSSFMFFLAFLFSLNLKNSKTVKLKIPFFPKKIIKENFSLYFSFFLRHTGANAVWLLFPLYLSELGAGKLWIGIIYFINALAQFVIMQYLDRFRSGFLVSTGLSVSVFVFLGFAVVQDFYQVIPVQFLLAVSWSCLYVGSILSLTERNIEKATSISILNSIICLSAITGPIAGGIVAEFFGMRGLMFFGAFLSLTGYLFFRCKK